MRVLGGRGTASATSKKSSGGGFTEEEQRELEWYVSGDGMHINNVLRGLNPEITPSDLYDSEKEAIKTLDGALNKNLKEQTLYRAVDATAIFGNMSASDFENLRNQLVYGNIDKGAYAQKQQAKAQNIINKALGKTITDKGFVSTTRDEGIASGWGSFTGSDKPIVMKIKTGKNTKGRDVSKASKEIRRTEKYDSQKETLLARNQKFTPTKVYAKNGVVYVDVKMK